ncbi:diphthamide synthesis DPH2 family, partial [Galdieria sulphuraria]
MPTEQLQFVRLGSTSFLLFCEPLYSCTRLFWIAMMTAQKSHVFGIVVSAIATKGVLDAIERCEVLLNQFE